MRISSTQFFQTGLQVINKQQADLMRLMQQIGSGQRMVTPADDPLAAAQAINMSQAHAMNARYAENREVAGRHLGIEENTLQSATTLLVELKMRLVEAGNGTMSDADRLTLADVLRHARDNLLSLANATDGNGQYLFSGSAGQTPPFDAVTGDYQGDTSQRLVQVDQVRRLSVADTGLDIFARPTPGVQRYLSYAGDGFTLPNTNQGSTVISGAVVVDAGLVQPGMRYEIRFIDAEHYQLEVYNVSAGWPGELVLPEDYPDHDDWTTPQMFSAGGQTIALPFGVSVALKGDAQAGDRFGVTSATDEDVNIFHTLDAMIHALEQPQQVDPLVQSAFLNTLAASIQRVDVIYDNLLTVRASVGARLYELDALDANGSLRELGYRQQLSRLEDLDYYQAATQLELRRSALEGAALAFRKIQETSLFNLGR